VDNMANHRNADDLAKKIPRGHHWVGVQKACRRFARQCQVCTRAKTRMKQAPCLQHGDREIDGTIAVDAIGPVDGAEHCMQTLCVMAVGCTCTRAVKRISSARTADFITSHVPKHGCPKQIVVDQGPENVGEIMQHLQNRLRLKFIKTSAKNGQGNSASERKHRPIDNGIMAMLLQNVEDRHNWHKCLEMMTFSVNATIDECGCSPAHLTFGHQPKFVADMESKSVAAPGTGDLDQRIQDLEKMRLLHATLKEDCKLVKNFRRNEKLDAQDEREVGDMVWLFRKENRKENAVTKKHEIEKTGPVTIVARSSGSHTHQIVDPKTGCDNNVHAKCLSPCGAFAPLPEVRPVAPDIEDNFAGENNEDADGSSSSSDSQGPSGNRISRDNVVQGERNRRPTNVGPCISWILHFRKCMLPHEQIGGGAVGAKFFFFPFLPIFFQHA